jgi:hypothetical protein
VFSGLKNHEEKIKLMNKTILTVHLEGPAVKEGRIALRDLVHFGRQFQISLERTARVLSGQVSVQRGQPPVDLRWTCALDVIALQEGSFSLTMELHRTQSMFPGFDLGEQALEHLIEGLEVVRSPGHELPMGYDLGVLVAWRDLGRLFDHGIERLNFDLHTPRVQCRVVHDYALHRRVVERIEGPLEDQIVREGRLLMADLKESGLRCRLHPPAESPIHCSFDEAMTEEIINSLRHYVRIRGPAEIDPLTGRVRKMEIRGLEILDWDEEKAVPVETRAVAEPGLFWAGYDVATLAEEQGVQPVQNMDDLWGDFWPEDESVDVFIETIRRWRREGLEA